jgi:hypothetical protein
MERFECGPRNVSNVEKIRESAHPRLIDALRNGMLKIHGAVELCKFSKAEQLERFICQSEDREIRKVNRRSIRSPREERTNPDSQSGATGKIHLPKRGSRSARSIGGQSGALGKRGPTPTVVATLEALLQQEAMQPGSVEVRIGDSPRSVVILSRELLAGTLAQRRFILI